MIFGRGGCRHANWTQYENKAYTAVFVKGGRYIYTILNNLHMNGNRCENLHIGLRVRFSGFLGQGSLLDLLTVLIS